MLLGICLAILLSWFVASYWETQQALRWWFRREAIDRAAQADSIQNGLIQDLFALRLSLQPLPNQVEESSTQQGTWLSQVEKLHHELNALSAMLVFPYVAESLPLAIRSLLEQWQLTHPQHQVQLDLPHEWQPEVFERSHMILSTLETLLNLALPASLSSASLEINLIDQLDRAELAVKITYPDYLKITSITDTKELKYLRRCFHCLASGWCRYHRQSLEAVWRFQWRH